MSNRKRRTNKVEYLYAVASGLLHPSNDPDFRDKMVHEGYLEQFRSPFRAYRARRHNHYRLTPKAYRLLWQRRCSLDGELRLCRSTMGLVIWKDRYATRVPIRGERKRELKRAWRNGDMALFA